MITNNNHRDASTVADPAEYPSRIVFAVSGLSPQIITETLYWLAVKREPAFVPTRLVVMTTTEGARRVRLLLRDEGMGWLARLCADYRMPAIPFAESDLRVISDADGHALDDLRSGKDNVAAANAIVEAVAELTRQPDSALHVSIAGGRKTQGFFAGYALSLYGRPQDRMSHVLVSSDFETHQEFFYPTPYSRVITTARDNRPLECRDAEVSLADLPFVRMREGLPDTLRTGRVTYAEAVDAAQGHFLTPPQLTIDVPSRRVIAGRGSFTLQNRLFAFYLWLARRAQRGRPYVGNLSKEKTDAGMALAKEFLSEYGAFVPLVERQSTLDAFASGYISDQFRLDVSRLNKRLAARIQDPEPRRYQIIRRGQRGSLRRAASYEWGLALPPGAIQIIE
jgi:CRISPR-associated protein (TIGR02584 family)